MTLQEFIDMYREQHGDMSMRKFAELVGVSPTTVSRWVDPESDERPDMISLIKLSKATGLDLLTLVEIAYPDEVRAIPVEPSAKILAAQIIKLPRIIREGIEKLIDAYLRQQGRE